MGGPIRKWKTRVLLTPLCLLLLMAWAGGAAAQSPICEGFSQGECDLQGDLNQASQCLSWAASFAEDGNAHDSVRAAGATGNLTCSPGPGGCAPEDVLPLSYESPIVVGLSSRYRKACVDDVMTLAGDPLNLDTDVGRRLLYEASFRKASAHGMFGDDRLVRGLNSAFDPNQSVLGNSLKDALLMLDSRVCRDPASPAVLTGSEALCQTIADCGANEICAPARFDNLQTGLFGAVQEYRRAEQAIMEAIRELGPDRFRNYDLEGSNCGGVGCAARLLIRLGGLRARAQAERLELQWARAAAAGGGITEGLVCSQPISQQTNPCALDRDCDSTPGLGDGVCGASGKERALVAVREEAAQMAAEAAASLAVYQFVSPDALAKATTDAVMMQNALADIDRVASRSLKNATPFGLPANYVPFLSDSQKVLLGCGTSNFACLQAILDGGAAGAPNTEGILDALDNAANQAPLNLDAYADAIRNSQTFETDLRGQFRDVLVRMFGPSCEPDGCSCSVAEQEEGLCFSFDAQTWVVAGLDCGDNANPFASCSTENADGALEQQLQSVRNTEVALNNTALEIERNRELHSFTLLNFLRSTTITSESCAQVQSIVFEAGNAISDAIDTRDETLGFCNQDRPIASNLDSAPIARQILGCGTGVVRKFRSVVRKLVSGITSMGRDPSLTTSPLGSTNEIEERHEDLVLQKQLSAIETGKQLDISQAECTASLRRITEVQAPEAIFNIETQRRSLIAKATEQRGAIIQAEIAVNQLVAEMNQAAQRMAEAEILDDIWDAADFRNPQNYRALALENQLKASGYLRRARLATWMLLRATAFDLARPDFVNPERRIFAGDIADVDACFKSVCEFGGVLSDVSCIRDADCSGGTCEASGSNADVAGSDGSCSLQAVFAARDAEDLRSLINRAFNDLAETDRDTACGGECVKNVSLRNIFVDPLSPDQAPLGEVLVAQTLSRNNELPLDFAVTLQRGFRLCPLLNPGVSLLDKVCQSGGVTGLFPDESGSPGETAADDHWNARILGLEARVTYQYLRDPRALLCRNPSTGRPVEGAEDICGGVPSVCLPNACLDALGNPIDCECVAIMSPGADPVFDLVQLGPGLVRTKEADAAGTVSPPPRDAFLEYRMWRGDLPTVDSEPELRPFSFSNIDLPSGPWVGEPDDSGQGIPVASPRWQLRLQPVGLVNETIYMSEYLSSIQDIDLTFTYEAFNLP